MLKLTRLDIQNFLSHRQTSLDLSTKEGLILISGKNSSGLYDSNGSGKSTILESIVYAISGDTLRGLSANDVINRNAKKNTKVSLSFDIDHESYRIDRYRKDEIHGDSVELWKSTETGEFQNISKRLNRDTQSLIDNLIDIPHEVLKNTIFLGEGLSSRFTQLSDPAKKSLIESTLSLAYDLSKCKDHTSSKLKELKLEKSNKEGQLSMLSGLLQGDISDIDKSIEAYESQIDYFQSVLDEAVKNRDSLQEVIPTIVLKIDTIKQSLEEYNVLYNKLHQLDLETASIVNQITLLESTESPECTMCHQKLESAESRDAVISHYKKQFESNSSQMREWQSTIDQFPDVSILNQKLTELQDSLRDYQLSLNSAHKTITDSSIEIERNTSQKQNAINLKENLQNYQRQSDIISSELTSVTKDIERYEYFYKLFSPTGIVTYILEDAITYINERIRVYTDILLDKTYKLVLSKGKISLEDLKGSTYQSLSNGEKRRLDISIQFSLHDYVSNYCGIGTNLLFIDEVLDTLDATGVNNIMEVLTLKREYCKLDGVYVITHNGELKSYFDEVITVVKDSTGDSHI